MLLQFPYQELVALMKVFESEGSTLSNYLLGLFCGLLDMIMN